MTPISLTAHARQATLHTAFEKIHHTAMQVHIQLRTKVDTTREYALAQQQVSAMEGSESPCH